MTKVEIAVTIIAAIIGSGILNLFVTHALLYSELKKEQKVGYENKIGEKILCALMSARELEWEVDSIQMYNPSETMNSQGFDPFTGFGVYPEITKSEERFAEFYNKVSSTRRLCEPYVGYKEMAYLYYMERYCLALIQQINKHGFGYINAGAIFVADFQKWQKKYEKVLVKKINKPKYKVYDKNSFRWEKAKKKVEKKLWEKSLLYSFIKDDGSDKVRLMKALLLDNNEQEAMKILDELTDYNKKHPIKAFCNKLKDKY